MNMDEGIPIYLDDTEYVILDTLTETTGETHLYPSNTVAQKLYRCIECMRDLLEMLEAIPEAAGSEGRRRRLKLMFTPLFSLVECVVDLLRDIQTNRTTTGGLPKDTPRLAKELENRLLANIPFGSAQMLREIRNRLSAHADRKMYPTEARELFSRAKESDVGLWLHTTLVVLTDLLKLPIYQWTCDSRFPGCFGVLSPTGPFLTIFGLKGDKLSHIEGCFLLKQDPRGGIFDLLTSVVEKSSWMFGPSDLQIRFVTKDGSKQSWAESLQILPEHGWDHGQDKDSP